MPSTLQPMFRIACIALLSGALAACGGSDAGGTTSTAVKDAADAAGAQVEEAVSGAGEQANADMAAVVSGEPDLGAGEKTYGRYCFSCHAAGVAGSPKLGSAEDWAPRTAKGLDMLVASTIKGIAPGMPARGLCSNCSDDELRNAVAWMISQQ